MSFEFFITLSNNDGMSRDDLRRWHPAETKVELRLYKSLFSNRGLTLRIVKRGEGEGGLLTDNADPDKPYWEMDVQLLPEIGHLLKLLRQNTKSGFSLQANWAGEYPKRQMEISIDEMVQIIEKGLIETRTRYNIK